MGAFDMSKMNSGKGAGAIFNGALLLIAVQVKHNHFIWNSKYNTYCDLDFLFVHGGSLQWVLVEEAKPVDYAREDREQTHWGAPDDTELLYVHWQHFM